MKPKNQILILLAFFGSSAFAQQQVTLKEAVDFGMKNSYSIKASEADFRKSEAKVREILAIGLPQVNASGQFNNYLNLPTTVIPANAFNPNAPADQLMGVKFGTDYNVTGSVTATQLLFDGSYLVGLQATKNLANLTRLNVELSERDVATEITKSYYTAIVADENVKTIRQTFETVEKLFTETKAIKENGFAEQQDVDQLTLTVSNLKNALARAEMMREAAYLSLKLNMGMQLDATLTLTESLETIVAAMDFQRADSSASVANTLEYQMLETQIKLNELNMKNEKMKYYPTLGAFFTQQYQAYRLDFDFFQDKPWYPATLWGVQLSIPIFSSGMRTAKVEQARIEHEKSQLGLEQLEKSLRVQTYMARTEFLTAIDAYKLQKESLALAESIQSKTLIKYKQGVATSMELTQAQNQYLTQQINYIGSLFNLLSAKATLEKLTGLMNKQ